MQPLLLDTGSAQWDEVMEAVEYGKLKGIIVKVTTVE